MGRKIAHLRLGGCCWKKLKIKCNLHFFTLIGHPSKRLDPGPSNSLQQLIGNKKKVQQVEICVILMVKRIFDLGIWDFKTGLDGTKLLPDKRWED